MLIKSFYIFFHFFIKAEVDMKGLFHCTKKEKVICYKIEKQLKMVMAITEAFMCCSGKAADLALRLQTIWRFVAAHFSSKEKY